MKLVKISDLFEVYYGVNLELNKLKRTTSIDGINFVSRTAKNNGVSAIVEKIDGVEPIPGGVLTVAGGGSVLETFLQPKPFYSGRDLYYLKPKIDMTNQEKLFYCMCIKANKYKYNYGRQANRTLKDILIPDITEIPDEVKQVNLNKFNNASKPIAQKQIKLDTSTWKPFLLTDLFIITGTKTTPKKELESIGYGKYPYVTTQDSNNAVKGFYDYYTEYGNVIVVDSATIGHAKYQPINFSASDHVEKLIPLFNMNKYIALFITTLLNLEQFKYGYGRKFSQQRLKKTKIKLPVNKNGEPDWQFMEDYIKTISYSSSI